jgi:anti-sigma B factor antagonist
VVRVVTGCAIDDRPLPARTYLISVAGVVDFYAAPELKEHVDRALTRGTTRLVIELARGAFIDSTTIGVLLGALCKVTARGATLRLVCSDPNLLRIFEIVELRGRFQIQPSLVDALA